MGDGGVAAWERDRLGYLVTNLRQLLPQVVSDRHHVSVDAHVAGRLRTNHTYGVTQRNGLEQDLADLADEIPGLVVRVVDGVHLLVVEETGTVIYPYRYAKNRRQQRTQSVMSTPLSAVRQMLFVQDTAPPSDQLTLEQGLLTEVELADLEAECADRRAAGQVGTRAVVLGYGSDPSGIWGIGWGEIEIRDPLNPDVDWAVWVALDTAAAGAQPGAGSLRAVEDVASAGPSFDAGAPADTGFGLRVRPNPAGRAPADEPTNPESDTGTGSSESDR